MNLKHTVKESLTFSKKERVGIIFLVPVILIIAFLPFFQTQPQEPGISPADSVWLAAASSLQEKNVSESGLPPDAQKPATTGFAVDNTESSYNSPAKGALFNFDPNTLDGGGFKKLGLRDKTIRTLINYRNKGGRFRKPDDLARVYGLRQEEFQRLKPYISIANSITPGGYSRPHNNYMPVEKQSYTPGDKKPRYAPKTIEINSADIAGFESLYGIGNKLAAKIVNFRNKLGGFYSIDQIGETYGVPDSTFQKIKGHLTIDKSSIKKININAATYDELNQHPYISSKTAYNIMKYRKENGNFSGTDGIRHLVSDPVNSFEKLLPYIKTE